MFVIQWVKDKEFFCY